MPHYRPYLLMWCLNISHAVLVSCHSIGHAFWCDASLQTMPSGVVPHYQPCLLVCCLTIGHAFWHGASLTTMHIVVLPHYRPFILVWCLIINHACWCGFSLYTMPFFSVVFLLWEYPGLVMQLPFSRLRLVSKDCE